MSDGVGDSHNFGRCVKKVYIDRDAYYLKPRTIYWEGLFFGCESPLLSVFESTSQAKYFKISEVSIRSTRYQSEIKSEKISSFDFHSFGFLTGYCFIFGIQDLNVQNLVITGSCLQPVDVEVVFSKLTSPAQTRLIPGFNCPFESSALHIIKERIQDISLDEVIQILSGFCSSINFFKLNYAKINEFLPKGDELGKHANRVIFKDTKLYYNLKNTSNLIDEEKIQLDRGDIPYFFKYGSNKKIFYYSQPETIKEVTMLPVEYQKIANNVGIEPAQLLNSHNIENILFPYGVFGILSSFPRFFLGAGKVLIGEFEIEFYKDKISLFGFDKKFILRLN